MEKVSEVYKNLYHYTSWAGLQGILASQSMWASNIKYLNDQSELLLAREPIHRLLLPKINSIIEEKIASSEQAKKFLDSNGGSKKFAEELARKFINATYHITGTDFYVVSFCKDSSNEYIKENGLLSQWRGYGSGGGFAIVFAAKDMELLLEHESKQYDYGPSNFSDAIYSDDAKMFESEFVPVINDFIEYIGEMVRQMVFGGQDPDGSKAMAALFWCTTRYKHLAFKEENEVRIVAAPTNQTQEYIDAHRKSGKAIQPLKQVKVRTANGKPIPYIELFGFPDHKLPISKIIVGPSADKEMIAAAVGKLVIGTKIEVTVSDIPYV